jgi:hypothetical protein
MIARLILARISFAASINQRGVEGILATNIPRAIFFFPLKSCHCLTEEKTVYEYSKAKASNGRHDVDLFLYFHLDSIFPSSYE